MNTRNDLEQENIKNKNPSYLLLVKQLEDRITTLKDKIKHQNFYKIDVNRLNSLKEKEFITILEMMNFKIDGLWFSCKKIQSKLLCIFIDWSININNQFESVYKSILKVESKKVIVNSCSKKNDSKFP